MADVLIDMLMILPVKLECEEHETSKGADSPIDLVHKSVFGPYGHGKKCSSYLTNKMPFFAVRPSEFLIVTMDALPMGAWSVVCDQILRCESRTTTLGLM